jgi:hypothetical protein
VRRQAARDSTAGVTKLLERARPRHQLLAVTQPAAATRQ